MRPAGERAALFIGPVPEDKLPKDATPGRTLVGTLSLSKRDGSSEDAPGKVALSYRCMRGLCHAALLPAAALIPFCHLGARVAPQHAPAHDAGQALLLLASKKPRMHLGHC